MKNLMVLAVALLLLAGCGQHITGDVVEDRTVKIGAPIPLTGNLAFIGTWIQNGFDMALEDLNKGDVKFELVYEDTVCEPKQTSTAMNKLYFADSVDAFAGAFCGSSVKTAAAFVDQNKVMMASPGNNFGKLTDYMFSTEHKVEDEARFLARYAFNNLSLRRIGLIYFDNDWGLEHKKHFSDEFEKLGGKITAVGSFEASTRDFRTIITKILAENSDAIYVVYSAPGPIINQIRDQSLDITILGQRGSENPMLLNIAGDNAEGMIYTYPTADGAERRKFEKRYEERYGEIPSIMSADAYDALIILGAAVNSCGVEDDQCEVDYVSKLRSYSGASGDLVFDGGIWNIYRPIQIRTVKDGKFVTV